MPLLIYFLELVFLYIVIHSYRSKLNLYIYNLKHFISVLVFLCVPN